MIRRTHKLWRGGPGTRQRGWTRVLFFGRWSVWVPTFIARRKTPPLLAQRVWFSKAELETWGTSEWTHDV